MELMDPKFELSLHTPDMVVSEIERLEARGYKLEKLIGKLEAQLRTNNMRYNAFKPHCPHKKDNQWQLERFAHYLDEHATQCTICYTRVSCPHPDPEPTTVGFYCGICGQRPNYQKGRSFH